MSDLVVTLTVIRERLPLLPGVLRTILDQSRRPDRVLLWISDEPYLLDAGVRRGELPTEVEDLSLHGAVEIRSTPNTGSHRKILPTLHLLRAGRRDEMVVTADDDTAYPRHWLAALEAGHEDTGEAVCFRARRITSRRGGLAPYEAWPLVPPHEEVLGARLLPTGKDGLLVRSSLLDERVYGDEYRTLCPSRADAWMTGALLAGGTRVLKLSHARIFPDPSGIEPLEHGELATPPLPDTGRCESFAPGPNLMDYNASHNDEVLRRTFDHFGVRPDVPSGCA